MNYSERIKALAGELLALVPSGDPELSVNRDDGAITIHIHKAGTYKEGEALLRLLGVPRRDKQVFPADELSSTWCATRGNIEPKMHVVAFCSGLPPSCRLVKKVERVPKKETVDTGEFIEIERTVVECGEPKPA